MNTIVSRRHILRFYTILLFATVFYSSWSVFLWHATSKTLPDKNPIWLYLMSVLCAVMAIYTIIRYFKNSPVVAVDETSIKFNNDTYYWTDILKIRLTGKQPFKYVINHDMEGMAVEFNDGTVKYLYDNVYSNLWQIKSFIQNVVFNKDKYYFVSENETLNVNTDYENFDFFRVVLSLVFEVLWLGAYLRFLGY